MKNINIHPLCLNVVQQLLEILNCFQKPLALSELGMKRPLGQCQRI